MRKLKHRKSIEANQTRRLCEMTFTDCICTLDGLCKCVAKLSCNGDKKETPLEGKPKGAKVDKGKPPADPSY